MDELLGLRQIGDAEWEVARGVAPNGDEWIITTKLMLFNWRLYVTPLDWYGRSYAHGFCYFGTEFGTAIRSVAAGMAWAEDPNPLITQPPGFDKEAF